jgi:hypothetical protein
VEELGQLPVEPKGGFLSSRRVDITEAMIMARRINHHNPTRICPAVFAITPTSANMRLLPPKGIHYMGPQKRAR